MAGPHLTFGAPPSPPAPLPPSFGAPGPRDSAEVLGVELPSRDSRGASAQMGRHSAPVGAQ